MRFDFLTIFPAVFKSYLQVSILGRARKKRRLSFFVHDLRQWARDQHRTVDDRPYGGGPGMIMKVEPIYRALQTLLKKRRNRHQERVILLAAKGKLFTQVQARRLAKKYQQLIFICGRYEGVDERVAKYLADEEFSIGPYVLTGGELPALVMADAVSRLIPGVLGQAESLREESFSEFKQSKINFGLKEYPHYTRPADFSPKKGVIWPAPKVLLSGDHKKIAAWRERQRRTVVSRSRAR